MEREIEFVAGPGVTALRTTDPVSQKTVIVGGNLLEVSATNPLIHVGSMNLTSFLRQAARRFDAEARAAPPDDTRAGNANRTENNAEEGGENETRASEAQQPPVV